MTLTAIALGLLIGLTLGALGGGGSILTVPALVYVLGQTPSAATTASLIIVGCTAAAGLLVHRRAGSVRLGQGVVFGLAGLAGTYAGARASAGVDQNVLLLAFAVLMLIAAAAMKARPPTADTGHYCRLPGNHCRMRMLAVATVVGLLSGFLGVGGGFVIVPALVLALGYDLTTATGTSLLVIALNSAAALATRLTTVHIALDWRLVGFFTLASIGAALVGGRLARRINPRHLSNAFILLIVALALYTTARSLPHLL